eukprot:Hpha_TRINITY_DN15946_c3_g7::TRINITY_DN15946_c3_g7_i1::g.73170::m.73170
MPLLIDVTLAGTSGALAVLFSHPLELTKTRLQLDQERAMRGTPRMYSSFADCLAQNYRSDGVRGLQRGLSLGVFREFCFNSVRIGLLAPVLGGVHSAWAAVGLTTPEATPSGTERIAGGLVCGAMGGCCVNPIEVLKVRMQSQGGQTGHQHQYRGIFDAWRRLVAEEGWAGCLRGIGTSTVRGILGPGSQIVAYNEIKGLAVSNGIDGAAIPTHVCCALLSAAISIACVNPVDVVRTRLYNAPAAERWYTSGSDVARQLLSNEGPRAFYKGSGAHFLRLGPHMILIFVILEQLKARFA